MNEFDYLSLYLTISNCILNFHLLHFISNLFNSTSLANRVEPLLLEHHVPSQTLAHTQIFQDFPLFSDKSIQVS